MSRAIGGALLAISVILLLGAVVNGQRGRRPGVVKASPESTDGLVFRLSEGVEEAEAARATTPAPSEPLSDADAQNVLDRLPPMTPGADDARDFVLREKSLPPPRTGKTIETPFPPPPSAGPPSVAAGPLEVVRFAPEGDVPLAPHLSVTFSQPMVAVTSQEEAARVVPVKLSPLPPGQWRWVGTKTLLFEPAARFPMSTEYTAEIAAGTKSATGGALAKTVTWRFSTPAPVVVQKHPVDVPTRREPLVFAAFDQRIDPAAVLATIRVSAGAVAPRLRLATAEEVQADEAVRALAQRAEAGRWMALRPEAPLPADAAVRVSVGPGTPSLEGPRRTEKAQDWSFRTFGPLRVKEQRCGWRGDCQPGMPWEIELTNPLDAKLFKKEMVQVTPDLPGLKREVFGSTLVVRGASRGRTTYTVTLAAELPDAFGQTLGKVQTLTFTVSPAVPTVWAPGRVMAVLDPAAPPRFSVYSVNQPSLKVHVYHVTPADWEAFLEFAGRGERATCPGRLAFAKTVRVQAAADEMVETPIDLGPALENGLGQVALVVEPAIQPKEAWRHVGVRLWIQATRIGLDAFADAGQLAAWATALADGKPLQGVDVELLPGGARAKTGPDGLASLALGSAAAKVLVARRGADLAMLPESTYARHGGWLGRSLADAPRWHVFDDRGLYRPGEEVHLKGWVRTVGAGPAGDVAAYAGGARVASYVLKDSRGNEVAKGDAQLNAFGAFDLVHKLPPTMNLGPAHLEVSLPETGAHVVHSFRVEEFRRPEFEVKTQASEGPVFVGGHATVAVTAAYYAGGALPNAEAAWRVTASPGQFTPPNRDDFVFGRFVPWWESLAPRGGPERTEMLSGRTDSQGKHVLRVDFDSVRPPRPWSVRAEATVEDVNRQAWTASSTLLVHSASLYVGLKSERFFVQRGQPLALAAIVTDLDGKAVGGRPITFRAERLDWEQEAGEWKEKAVDVQEKRVTSADEAERVSFDTREGGTYRITATVADDRDRVNETEMRLWVAGGKQPPARNVTQEKVTLIPSQKEYRRGDVAEILVIAPFADAEGLLTLRRAGVLRKERFRIEGTSHTIKIAIEEAWTPNVHVQVDLVGAAPRVDDSGKSRPNAPARPAFASGTIDLSVPPYERTLAVSVAPRDKALEPGGKTEVAVEVKDVAGKPLAGAEVVLFAADEAVLALGGYQLADPLATFYARRGADTEDRHSRSGVVLAEAESLEAPATERGAEERRRSLAYLEGDSSTGVVAGMAAPAPLMRAKKAEAGRMSAAMDLAVDQEAGAGSQPIALRTDFNPLALFVASAVTDAAGRASAPVKLPDNLTRYRVMAVATDGARRFGKSEAAITARLPLMVRPSAPRFLNFGDRFELPIVVQNQTDAPMVVDVAARASNATLTAEKGRRVRVPANDRAEVRLPVAAVRAGTARFQVGAASGRWADAAEVTLPVWTPATTEAFATYGQIDDEKAVVQPVQAPPGVIAEYGGLEITTSSTALQALTDAVVYLASYPYGCAEQISSRVLAVAALKDVLAAFEAEGLPKSDELVAAVGRDLERLKGMQNPDGGFAFWRRGEESWPYVSIHAAHALVRAKEKGFAADAGALVRSREYLQKIESHIPKWYGDHARRTLIAYALYVRGLMNDRDRARARRLVAEAGLEGLPFEAVGWVLSVLTGDPASTTEVAAIRRFLANRATETASTAHFAVDYGDGAYVLLYSDRRADAIVLDALIADQPGNDLIPKLVEGLLGHRKAGRWLNTQENVFVLLALDRYFATYEKVTPNFVARAWLGERYAGEHAFRGRTTERQHIGIPMRFVAEGRGAHDLILAKQGPGRLYYRIGMQYAPADLTLAPADYGFTVERKYEGADDKADVRRDAEGTWHVKAGARVRVKLTMVATSRRYHVALVDPLPAGLEPLNPELKTTGSIPPGESEDVTLLGAPGLGGPRRPGWWWWWTRPWYEHQNMRDERVEAFASLLFEGVYSYSYVARATTPGAYVVPPPKAEEMYQPETFGRGATERLVVE